MGQWRFVQTLLPLFNNTKHLKKIKSKWHSFCSGHTNPYALGILN
jgi:hypothetical protein